MKLESERDDHVVGFTLMEQFMRWGGRLQHSVCLLLSFHPDSPWTSAAASSFIIHPSYQKKKISLLKTARVASLSGLCCFTRLLIDVVGCCWMHTGVSFMFGLKVLLSTSWFQVSLLVPEKGLVCSIFRAGLVKWPGGRLPVLVRYDSSSIGTLYWGLVRCWWRRPCPRVSLSLSFLCFCRRSITEKTEAWHNFFNGEIERFEQKPAALKI